MNRTEERFEKVVEENEDVIIYILALFSMLCPVIATVSYYREWDYGLILFSLFSAINIFIWLICIYTSFKDRKVYWRKIK